MWQMFQAGRYFQLLLVNSLEQELSMMFSTATTAVLYKSITRLIKKNVSLLSIINHLAIYYKYS